MKYETHCRTDLDEDPSTRAILGITIKVRSDDRRSGVE